MLQLQFGLRLGRLLCAGAHGRHSLTDELTVIGGFSYGEFSADGVTVSNAASIAGSLIYDFVNWGRSRPFVEVGGGATPFEDVKYSRSYANGATTGQATARQSTETSASSDGSDGSTV